MLLRFNLLLVVAVISFGCHPTSYRDAGRISEDAPPSVEEMLYELNVFSSGDRNAADAPDGYQCSVVIPLVNRFRHLGKERVLEVLRRFYREHPQDQRLLMTLARLLFVPPRGGWTIQYRFSVDPSMVQPASVAKFPSWPVVVSDGVPFLLPGSVELQGAVLSDEGNACLEQCAALTIFPVDWPTSGFKPAAEDLIRDNTFQRLYLSPTLKNDAVEMIHYQAGM